MGSGGKGTCVEEATGVALGGESVPVGAGVAVGVPVGEGV